MKKNIIPNELIRRLVVCNDLPQSGKALVIGFGESNEIEFLQRSGFQVTGIEKNKNAFSKKNLTGADLYNVDLQDFEYEKNNFNLILARNVLPFIPKDEIIVTLEKLSTSLKEGGFLIFTLFGPNNDKLKYPISTFTPEEIKSVTENLNLMTYYRSTEEGYGRSLSNNKLYWHIYKFILEKPVKDKKQI